MLERWHVNTFARLHVGTLERWHITVTKLESCKLNNKLHRSTITMNNAGQITYEV